MQHQPASSTSVAFCCTLRQIGSSATSVADSAAAWALVVAVLCSSLRAWLSRKDFSVALCAALACMSARERHKKKSSQTLGARAGTHGSFRHHARLNSPRHGLHRRYWHARHRSQRSAMIDDDDRDDRAIVVRRLGRFHFSERLGRFSVSRARNGRDDRRKASVVRSS